MAKKNMSNIVIFGIVFGVLFHLHGGVIARNVGVKETVLAIVFYFLPIVFAVYNICSEHAVLPRYLKRIGLFAVSFLLINQIYSFMIDMSIIMGGEEAGFSLWAVRFLPILIWIGYTLIIDKIDFERFRKIFVIFLIIQLSMIGYIFLHHFYSFMTGTVGTYFFVETGPYLLTLLSLALPFSLLIFYNFTSKDFKKPYRRAIIISIILMIGLIIIGGGAKVSNDLNFENAYYLDSLYLNYPHVIAYAMAILEATTRLFVAIFIYTIVVLKIHENEKIKYNRALAINIGLVLITLYFLVFKYVVDMSELINYQFVIGALIQLFYVFVLVFYGFYVALRQYEVTLIKFGLFVFPSFIVIYYIYNISKVWHTFGAMYIEFVGFIDNYLLIISLGVMIYYTLETALLWYAYSKNKSTDDLPQVPVEKELHMFVMIPCMNEEIVIGNTLTSLLGSNYKNLHLVVIDDASEDDTAKVVNSFDDPRLRLVQRVKPNAQEGKGEALNYVYYMLRDEIAEQGIDFNDVLIAIIDADTLVPLKYFEKVNYVFNARREVTGLQSKVRVISTNSNKAQDLEFAEIINATQTWRSMTNTVAFGGNGQFCKLSTLETLNEKPWSTSLVEDFDLSTRLFLSKDSHAIHSQYSDIYIVQSGIDDDKAALVKQRVRWSQGNIQSAKYIIPILISRDLQKRQKFELLMTLIKPWLMGIEYVIVVYTMVTIVDLFILQGMTRMMAMVILLFLMMVFYILAINFIWAYLYNRNKSEKIRFSNVVRDCYYLSMFLITLAQIYPQSTIRHLKSENGWDKTKRKQGGM